MSTPASSILYVGNFPQHRPISDLRALFEPFGEISEISLPEASKEQLRDVRNQKKPSQGKGGNNKRGGIRGGSMQQRDSTTDVPLNRGFGFVAFEEIEDASHALQNMDQSEFWGQILKVTWTTRRNFEESAPELTREEREAFLRENVVDAETREQYAKESEAETVQESEQQNAPGENAEDAMQDV